MKHLNFSDNGQETLWVSQQIAQNYGQAYYSAAHLLQAILQNKTVRSHLTNGGIDVIYLDDWAHTRLEIVPKAFEKKISLEPDEKVLNVLEEADNLRIELDRNDIDIWSLLMALIVPNVAFSYDQLKTIQLSKKQLLGLIKSIQKRNSHQNNPPKKTPEASEALQSIDESDIYENKTAKVVLNPSLVVGREKTLQMMIEVMGRHTKPNVLLVGKSGVGKTSLLNGVATFLLQETVSDDLKNLPLFEINLLNLLSSNNYRGESVEKLKKGLTYLGNLSRIIVCIEDVHQLLLKNSSIESVGNWLKSKLNSYELSVLATTTPDEFTKTVEKDSSFLKYFEVIHVDEPSIEEAIKMVDAQKKVYEQYHQLVVSESSIIESVRLASRFLKNRALPDSALDLIDRTMASLKHINKQLFKLQEECQELFNTIDKLTNQEKLENIKESLSSTLVRKLAFDKNELSLESIPHLLKKIEEYQNTANQVDDTDIACIVSEKTGIPLGKLQSQEQERLLQMEEHFKQRIIGQDHAIKSIADALIEARSGLNEERKPIGSFFLLGPTGTGKTELARTLADFLFQDENFMIRFNMSEFKEEHAAALLYGAPPGYVGYEEGGLLVNKIREQPYSVVLFDEIEKAHASVFDVFLQILDEGKLSDKLGREGDFSNSVVLFTSNIAQEYIVSCFKKGFIPSQNDLMERMSHHFRPEFLARLTEIIPFSFISQEMVLGIFKIQLRSLLKGLEKKNIGIEISEQAQMALATQGYSEEYGARPLKGVIRDKIRRPLSRMIVAGQVKSGDTVLVAITDQQELHWSLKM